MAQSEKTSEQGSRLLIDAGPIGVWILVYNGARAFVGSDAIYWGTGAYMVAAVIALVASMRIEKRVPPMLVFTTVIVLFMGALGIFLQDPIFIYVKPTIINLFLSVMILVSLAFGTNVWKVFFSHIFNLPDEAWTILAIRWALWFQFLALLNEGMWRHISDSVVPESARWFAGLEISEAFWSNAKLGVLFLSVLFALAQMPLMSKYQGKPEAGSEA
ncbi:inner membrane-spanning protein YciB [Maricaulis sp. CAU 1757]